MCSWTLVTSLTAAAANNTLYSRASRVSTTTFTRHSAQSKTSRRSCLQTCRSQASSTTTTRADRERTRRSHHRCSRTRRCQTCLQSQTSQTHRQRSNLRSKPSRSDLWTVRHRRRHRDRASTSREAMCPHRRLHLRQETLATTTTRLHHLHLLQCATSWTMRRRRHHHRQQLELRKRCARVLCMVTLSSMSLLVGSTRIRVEILRCVCFTCSERLETISGWSSASSTDRSEPGRESARPDSQPWNEAAKGDAEPPCRLLLIVYRLLN